MTYARELELTVARLRQLSGARLEPVADAFHTLLAGLTPRPVPRLSWSAWGDQLLLIGREAQATEARTQALRAFRRSLDLTPLAPR